MKKNKQTVSQRKATLKRGKKRNDRLKNSQGEKHVKKLAIILEKKKNKEKQDEELMKILQSRNNSMY